VQSLKADTTSITNLWLTWPI